MTTTPSFTGKLRERLRLAGGTRASRGARGWLSWWSQALLSWLPRSWRLALGMDRGRLLLEPVAGTIALHLQDADGLRELAKLPRFNGEDSATASFLPLLSPTARDLPRWLLLPAGAALRRKLSLPAAAGERLRDVVGFEVDRQTPFGMEDVAFDARLLGQREGGSQIEAELVAVPRTTIEAATTTLGDLADGLVGIDVLSTQGTPLGVNLLAPSRRGSRSDPMRRWNLLLAAVAVLAFAAMLWQVLQNRRAGADAFEQQANARARAARSVSAQRQALVDIVDGQAFLDRSHAGRPSAIEVLDDLTKRLPDGTYVEKFEISGDRITLIGRSNDASGIPGRLQGSKLWRAPALAGALQPDPRTGRDIFTLTAELAITGRPQEARSGAGQ